MYIYNMYPVVHSLHIQVCLIRNPTPPMPIGCGYFVVHQAKFAKKPVLNCRKPECPFFGRNYPNRLPAPAPGLNDIP